MKKLLLLATIVASLAASGCHHCGLGRRVVGAYAPTPIATDGCCESCNDGCTSCGESPQYGAPMQSYGDPGYSQPEMIVPGPIGQ